MMRLNKKQCAFGILVAAALWLGAFGCAAKTAPVQDAPLTPAAADADTDKRLITGIAVEQTAQAVEVAIQGTEMLTYTAVKSPFTQGIVLYFPETGLGGISRNITAGNSLVTGIISTQSESVPVSSRVEIALSEDVPFEVRQEGRIVVVSLGAPAPLATPAAAPLPAVLPASQPAPTALERTDARLAEYEAAPAPAPKGPARLRQIDFIQENDGKSVVRIRADRPVDFAVRRIGERRLLMDLPGVHIPEPQRRPLITTRFDSAADRIIPVQKDDQTASISIELREFVPYRVDRKDGAILLHLDASSIPPRPQDSAALPSWEEVAKEPEKPLEDIIARPRGLDILDMGDHLGLAEPTVFTGERIALDFYRTDIKNVFRILKEVSGLNFAIDADVEGEVTLTIDKPVPWDQVLHLILKMNQLGSVRTGDIVRISKLATLEAESKAARERIEAESRKEEAQRAAKLAQEQARKASQPQRLEYIPINYANCTEVAEHLESFEDEQRQPAPDGAGTVLVQVRRFPNLRCDVRTNTVLIIATEENIREARAIVEQLDRPTPQVMIEARIVEASSTFQRDIGIDWGGSSGIQPGDARAGRGPQRGYDSLGGTYGYNWAVNYGIDDTANILGFNFRRLAGLTPFTLDATLAALESRGSAKIVSAPKILTLDNKQAIIKQGIEYPIIVLDESGNPTTEYHDVDLLLEVTPHVTADRRISMKIKTTKNDIGERIEGEISFSTKEVQTELLLDDGDTVVIGGIIKTTRRDQVEGVPWLNRIPVLGWLFKSDSVVDNREELLVFITPRIVDLAER
ncbi:MAG: type IV pilus secretin PilQ [Desulfatibacillaceae bacterium]|nr:type IV pilus secretin PilQ [Desulfatibacillaceae bacterium]